MREWLDISNRLDIRRQEWRIASVRELKSPGCGLGWSDCPFGWSACPSACPSGLESPGFGLRGASKP